MARIIANGSWDLLHCQGSHAVVAFISMLAARRRNLPYVLTFHSGGYSSHLRSGIAPALRQLLRPLLLHAERLICVSDFEARHFQRQLRLAPQRFTVVPNGANLGEPSVRVASQPQRPLILSVGRLERYKGHHHVLAALPEVIKLCPQAQLRIAGNGPFEPNLRRLARRLGVEDRVEIKQVATGDHENMAQLLSQAAVVTIMSEYESQSIAAYEALAAGKALLVAPTSALRELADRGMARAVPHCADPVAVARSIVDALRSPLPPAQVSLPTWDQCAERMLDIYREALAVRRCSSAASGSASS